MKRSEQDIRFQWDLTKIYPDTAAWEAAMQEAEAALAPLAAIPGTLGTSKEAFKKGLDTIYASMFKVELPYTYAFLKKTEDGSVAENQEMAARSESLLVKFNAAIAFLSPEILAIPAEKLDEWMQDEALATYRHTVDDIVRMRAHTLDAAREQMLALLGDAAGTPKAAFEMLTDVDLQLPMVKNEAGEEVRLTAGTFPVFRESRDRSVREGAFRAMFGTYRQFGDAIATLYGGSVKFDTYFSNQRGYASACEAALDGGNVPVSVYDSLIEAVHESLPSMRKYLELRRRALKLDKIDVFDLYVPIVEDVDYPIAFEDAKELVKKALTEMGYEPRDCGKAGVIALAGGKKPGKTILLRADMDALPIPEDSGEEFSSEVPGKMHGCGHDMHTAMLLGAAKLLKAHEDELEGTVKLEFQPAEEIFQGSPDMIAGGLLEDPHVDAAVMFHVLAGMPLPVGTVLVPGGGITMASCEQYHIVVKGKGGHGSTPENCIDPITAAAHTHIALQEINSRELKPGDFGVLTTGRFEAGAASNVIPDVAQMWGTIRTTDPENKTGELIRTRMTEIAQGVAAAFRCTAEVSFADYCPCMVVDKPLAENAMDYMTELLGKGAMDMTALTGGKPGGGSEDFAFVSHEVPTVSMFIAAGGPEQGCCYGQHHPKVRFDDSILYEGSAAFGWFALRWLYDNAGIAF